MESASRRCNKKQFFPVFSPSSSSPRWWWKSVSHWILRVGPLSPAIAHSKMFNPYDDDESQCPWMLLLAVTQQPDVPTTILSITILPNNGVVVGDPHKRFETLGLLFFYIITQAVLVVIGNRGRTRRRKKNYETKFSWSIQRIHTL